MKIPSVCRCKLVQYLIIATAYVSIYTLVFMSLDRFLAVVYPIESMTLRTESNCRKAIIATWDERTEDKAEADAMPESNHPL